MATVIALLVSLALIFGRSTFAQTGLTFDSDSATRHHTDTKLILSSATATPGETILAGVVMKMDSQWHTYWKSPGAAGMATTISWKLPPGVTAGDIEWPLPQKLPPVEVTTYGYTDNVVLIVPLTISSNVAAGPLNLKASVSWLECKETCLPASADVAASLTIGDTDQKSPEAGIIQAWLDKVPKPLRDWNATAWWEQTTNSDQRFLNISLQWQLDNSKRVPLDGLDFFPGTNDNFDFAGATDKISAPGSDVAIRKLVKKLDGAWPATVAGTLALTRGNLREGFDVTLPVAAAPPSTMVSAATADAASPASTQPLWLMLIYALIGGCILNIMPCVLPVIALKILGFVNEAKSSPRHVRKLGAVYCLGVLVSFAVLASVVIAVKAAGHQAGWGMQFGNPIFIVCLTTLVTLVALNLFGIFEVNIGGGVMNTAGELASKSGMTGAFFNGVLATALATPCTAPILSIALGFAFAQSAAIIMLFFLTIGLGLAAPYMILSWNPAWLKFLPKPGAWMEKFKIAMGFPMLATVCWLVTIAFDSYGRRTLWLGIFLVTIAAAAWVFGEFFQRSYRRRNLALGVILILLVGGYAFALEDKLQWRKVQPAQGDGSPENIPGGIHWQAWSPQAIASARAQGHPVLVDFTADWCLTCQVNKSTSIEVPSVREKLKDVNAIALVADYTRLPDSITSELRHFNRAGVPLVLVYPKNPNELPIVLPEVLTPGIVLNAIEKAGQ